MEVSSTNVSHSIQWLEMPFCGVTTEGGATMCLSVKVMLCSQQLSGHISNLAVFLFCFLFFLFFLFFCWYIFHVNKTDGMVSRSYLLWETIHPLLLGQKVLTAPQIKSKPKHDSKPAFLGNAFLNCKRDAPKFTNQFASEKCIKIFTTNRSQFSVFESPLAHAQK